MAKKKIRTILIVDDLHATRIAAKLRNVATTLPVTSGTAALSVAEKHHPEAALVDFELAEESGIDVIRSLHDAYPRMLIGLCTGHESDALYAEAYAAGARYRFDKPVRDGQAVLQVFAGPVHRPQQPQRVRPLDESTYDLMLAAFSECHGNKSEAARRLGIARSTLKRKLREARSAD